MANGLLVYWRFGHLRPAWAWVSRPFAASGAWGLGGLGPGQTCSKKVLRARLRVLPGVPGSSFPPPVLLELHGLCRRPPSELQPVATSKKRLHANTGSSRPRWDPPVQCPCRDIPGIREPADAQCSAHARRHSGAAQEAIVASGRVPRSDKAARITRLAKRNGWSFCWPEFGPPWCPAVGLCHWVP